MTSTYALYWDVGRWDCFHVWHQFIHSVSVFLSIAVCVGFWVVFVGRAVIGVGVARFWTGLAAMLEKFGCVSVR